MSRTAQIFLNYPGGSPDDSEHALRLGEMLESYGLPTWVTERDRLPGQEDRHEQVLQSATSCRAFIACIGTRRPGSWGRKELDIANERAENDEDFLLLTVLLPGSDPANLSVLPSGFGVGQVFDMRDGVVVGTVAPLVAALWRGLNHERARLLDQIVAALRGDIGTVVLTGPAGAGKTILASVVAAELAKDFPGGRAIFRVDPERSVERMLTLALRTLRTGILTDEEDPLFAYRSRLAQKRYLLVFDGVTLPDATDLVPPHPSAALIVSQFKPLVRRRHVSFEVPPFAAASTKIMAPADESWVATNPGFHSDSPEGADLLAIAQPVEALCSVIAAKDVKPPLSIGLFGEWGAGKTFFIRKMQAHIESLARASREAETSAFCSSIHQISFNAWHYADTNLWASLASRVFEGLAGETTESERLFANLASSRLQLEEASAEQEVAQRRLVRAGKEERRAKEELAAARVKMADLATAAVDVLDEIDPSPLLADLRAILRLKPGEDFGVDAAKRLRTARGAIAQLWRQAGFLLTMCVVTAVAVAALLLFFPNAIALAITALGLLGFGSRLAGGPLRWIIRAHAEAQTRSEALRRQESAKLEAELEQLRKDESEARHRQEDAQRQVDVAEQEISEINDGRRLFRFIAERSRGDTYEPYLGLMALVRRDFERLSDLIEEQSSDGDGALPPLERIVLYVDDLDRCPAERVVEVLEAVHLLMASSLFVVVVAVDPRWLLSSLERHYSKELTVAGSNRWSPTPQDYLEKIFQIPFMLPSMEDDGFRRLIESSIQVRTERPGPGEAIREAAGSELESRRESPQVSLEEQPLQAEAIDLEPKGLLIGPEEVEFMAKLRRVVRTPRSAKRLANLYRLARASLTKRQLDILLGHDGEVPAYPAMLIMLAMVIGYPALCSSILNRLALGRSTESWWDFVDEWEPPDDLHSWRLLVEALAPLRPETLPDLGTFASLVPQVARYSYSSLQPASAALAQ